MLVENAIKQ